MAEHQESKGVALVVEDDEQVAEMIRFILEQDGYEVHVALDGRAAGAFIERLPPPSVVTLDIALPDTSGVELIVRIKSTPGWERVPIIMVTAKPKEKEVNWAIKSGAKAYVVKPFKPEELRERVRRVAAPKTGPG